MAEGGLSLFTCDICGQEGLQEDEMRTHILLEHVEGAISCPFCDLEGTTAEEMTWHIHAEHLEIRQEIKPVPSPVFPLTGRPDDSTNDLPGLPENIFLASAEDISTITTSSSSESTRSDSSDSMDITVSRGEVEQQKRRARLHLDVAPASPHKSNKVSFCDTIKTKYLQPMRSSSEIERVRVDDTSGDVKDILYCPICSWKTTDADAILRHVNVKHLDPLSPAAKVQGQNQSQNGIAVVPVTKPAIPKRDSQNNIVENKENVVYECPFCGIRSETATSLEIHVNTKHLDILSPDSAPAQNEMNGTDDATLRTCPVCGMEDLAPYALSAHVEGHFSSEHTPVTERSAAADHLLAQELERRERFAAKYQEQVEFEKLKVQHGFDNKTNFNKQADKNMSKEVVSGQMSVTDYYSRKVDLQQANALGIDDGSSCTKGIIPKFKEFYTNNIMPVKNWWLCSDMDHYASTHGDKGWGCGYRNLQMLFSSLAKQATYSKVLFNGRPAIPSIIKIQRLIEAAWQKGFDLQGCEQLGGKVVNTNKWIGATEVVATLASLRVKCQLFDFHAPSSSDGTHPRLFEWVRDYFKKDSDFKPPLYLQHHGHSRTIVGIEELTDGSMKLLIFDPIYSKKQMQQFCGTINANMMRTIRRTMFSLKAKQYQIVAATGILSDSEYEESKIIKSDRIPA